MNELTNGTLMPGDSQILNAIIRAGYRFVTLGHIESTQKRKGNLGVIFVSTRESIAKYKNGLTNYQQTCHLTMK